MRFDGEGRVRHWNAAAAALFELAEGKEATVQDILPGASDKEFRKLIEEGEHYRWTIRVKHHPCTITVFGIPEVGEGVICLHEHWQSTFL